MPISIIIGGQFGSEGKGKVAHYFARKLCATGAIRVGGPNSGHTVYDEAGKKYIFKMLPTAAILPKVECYLASGSYIDVDILEREIFETKLEPSRLKIDPYSIVITDKIKTKEKASGRRSSIGSTDSGTGAAVSMRVDRTEDMIFAKDEPRLKKYIDDTKVLLREQLERGNQVILEGTQGFGLSVIHSEYFPKVTSRDTTAAGFLSEAGLSPLDVENVIMVIRSFPIRVPGNSGPLKNEVNWDYISKCSGAKNVVEYTSVTNQVRRVAKFDEEVVKKAIICNNPNVIVMNHLDYIDTKISSSSGCTRKAKEFIGNIEFLIGREINYGGVSPERIIGFSSLGK